MDAIRRAELEDLRAFFRPGARVLELGGGRGLQAAILSSWGCEVHSVDVAGRELRGDLLFPIQEYDGSHLPFSTATFDVVFSSNVLEHVVNLHDLLSETRRVLVAGGIALHLMPSASWRFWTSVTHYISLLQFGMAAVRNRRVVRLGCFEGPQPRRVIEEKGWAYALRRAALPRAHGEYRSAVVELGCYTRIAWRRVLRTSGFETSRAWGQGVFYAGYGILPRLSLPQRRKLAAVLGSACNVFLTRPTADTDP